MRFVPAPHKTACRSSTTLLLSPHRKHKRILQQSRTQPVRRAVGPRLLRLALKSKGRADKMRIVSFVHVSRQAFLS